MNKKKEIKINRKEKKNLKAIVEFREMRDKLINMLSRVNAELESHEKYFWNDVIKKYKLDRKKHIYYSSDTKKVYEEERPPWELSEERKRAIDEKIEQEQTERMIQKYEELTKELKRQNDLAEDFKKMDYFKEKIKKKK